jgi:hypothetical protein
VKEGLHLYLFTGILYKFVLQDCLSKTKKERNAHKKPKPSVTIKFETQTNVRQRNCTSRKLLCRYTHMYTRLFIVA